MRVIRVLATGFAAPYAVASATPGVVAVLISGDASQQSLARVRLVRRAAGATMPA